MHSPAAVMKRAPTGSLGRAPSASSAELVRALSLDQAKRSRPAWRQPRTRRLPSSLRAGSRARSTRAVVAAATAAARPDGDAFPLSLARRSRRKWARSTAPRRRSPLSYGRRRSSSVLQGGVGPGGAAVAGSSRGGPAARPARPAAARRAARPTRRARPRRRSAAPAPARPNACRARARVRRQDRAFAAPIWTTTARSVVRSRRRRPLAAARRRPSRPRCARASSAASSLASTRTQGPRDRRLQERAAAARAELQARDLRQVGTLHDKANHGNFLERVAKDQLRKERAEVRRHTSSDHVGRSDESYQRGPAASINATSSRSQRRRARALAVRARGARRGVRPPPKIARARARALDLSSLAPMKLKAENDEYSDAPFAPAAHGARRREGRAQSEAAHRLRPADTYLDRLKQEARAPAAPSAQRRASRARASRLVVRAHVHAARALQLDRVPARTSSGSRRARSPLTRA